MKIFEIGTGYTSIPANKGAATEIVVENLSHALINRNHDVTVVDIADAGRLPTDLGIVEVPMPRGFSDTDAALGVKHKLKRVVYSIELARTLKRLLEKETDKVVLHFHNQYNAYFFYRLVPKRSRSKALVAYTNHSGAWNGDWEQIESTIRKKYFQEASAQKSADLVFALNKKTVENLIEHANVRPEAVVPIANGVDVATYHPISRREARLVSEKYFGAGTRYVFQCGSVCPNKGQLRSVKALEPLMKADASLCFGYAGGVVDRAYADEVVEYCRNAGIDGQVSYLGEKRPGAELAELYAASEGFVFPSEYEAFSVSLLEALSCGIPTIRNGSARVVSIAEPDEGLIDYHSDVGFTECLDKILSLPPSDWIELSKTARNAIVERYSWDKVARDYAAALSKSLERIN